MSLRSNPLPQFSSAELRQPCCRNTAQRGRRDSGLALVYFLYVASLQTALAGSALYRHVNLRQIVLFSP